VRRTDGRGDGEKEAREGGSVRERKYG